MIDVNKLKVGDVLSEESHYIVKAVSGTGINVEHLESGTNVNIGVTYARDLLASADQYTKTVEVTREDKADGTEGIRTIFERIRSSEVFTVVFRKQDKAKTKKQYEAELAAQREEAIAMIDKAKKAKKSMADAYKEALEMVQNNPVKDYTEGDLRTLRGFKQQFTSRDGKYNCMDMDIKETRPVNINTIIELTVRGVKYVVK